MKQILADMLGFPIHINNNKEECCLGACITAGIGSGIYASFQEASMKVISFSDKIYRPREANKQLYDESFQTYKDIYKTNETLFK